jgi:hypothetical protein
MPSSLRPAAAAVLAVLLLTAGCGKGDPGPTLTNDRPVQGARGSQPEAATGLGFPLFATKNTTRVGGADAIADAAGVAQAVFPSTSPTTRPPTVALADAGDWRAAVAASVLMARPVRAPLLLAEGGELPEATRSALERLSPTGSGVLGGAQVVRVGDVPEPDGLRTTSVSGADPFAVAASVDRLSTSARGKPSGTVLVVGSADPAYAMPAAAWAAKSGDPVLFVERDRLPAATERALRRHERPRIYVLGPASQVSGAVVEQLGRLGTVERIGGPTPQRSAVAFARYSQDGFGWGVVDPGHGVVFANPSQPLTAAAAAPLSSSGSYGPLLLTDAAGALPDTVVQFLLDIQPGYDTDPVRGVYNHGWLIGDERTIGADTQSRIDALLEISPVNDEPSS